MIANYMITQKALYMDYHHVNCNKIKVSQFAVHLHGAWIHFYKEK